MSGVAAWPLAEPLATPRLLLDPLLAGTAAALAVEVAGVLDDERLHEFIGGRPATGPELVSRYRRMAAGQSPDGTEGWLNWVVRARESGDPVGTVQATLTREGGQLAAELAWVIATAYQGSGYAAEAATALADWLGRRGVTLFTAHVHPAHAASATVARRVGLHPTDVVHDGETLWTSPIGGPHRDEQA